MPSFEQILAEAANQFQQSRPMLPTYLHLITAALFPIYAGAHASLTRPSSAAKPQKSKKKKGHRDEDEEDEDTVQQMEGLSAKDAILFPITAGLVLAALYWAIKKYGADLINLILGFYFSIVGLFSVASLINDAVVFLMGLVFPTYFTAGGKLWKVNGADRKIVEVNNRGKAETLDSAPLPGYLNQLPLPRSIGNMLWSVRSVSRQKYALVAYVRELVDIKANITALNVLSAILAVAAILYNVFVDKAWWLTNLQGYAVSYMALQLMSPTTFATGSLILSGLFFYDIWAVFFTPLMVTVAKNLDQPIKLLFPRPDERGAEGKPSVKSFSMLGLGDIVLPGLMIGLALRFDLYMFYLRKQKATSKPSGDVIVKASYTPATGHWGNRLWTFGSRDLPPSVTASAFPKPYFTAAMTGYLLGLLATIGVMTVFHHAQPALLYLVPGVLISLWSTAIVRGELKDMWEFSEAVNGEADDGKDTKTESKEDKEQQVDRRSWWQAISHELFGSEVKKDTPATKSETDRASKKEKKTAKQADASEKSVSAADPEDDTILAFSIKLHQSQGKGSPVDRTGRSADDDAQVKWESSGSGSEDAVVIDHGPDGATEIEPVRNLRSRKGKASKDTT